MNKNDAEESNHENYFSKLDYVIFGVLLKLLAS